MDSWDKKLLALVGNGFASELIQVLPLSYKQATFPRQAVKDIAHLEALRHSNDIEVDFSFEDDAHPPCLRFYTTRFTYLDTWLPPINHLGLRVVDQSFFRIPFPEGEVFLRCFHVEPAKTMDRQALKRARAEIIALLTAVFSGRVEDDQLNGLILSASLSWRLVNMLRGYRNYFFQLGSTYSSTRFHNAFLDYPQVAKLLCDYFETRFDPSLPWTTLEKREEEGLFPLRQALQKALEPVVDMHADRILRTVFNLIDATVRTNFYCPEAEDRLAFKLSGLGVIEMPAPMAKYEVYVHSTEMEAVHLRGGKVARGGIRWSDRQDDFRTEVWELMRTQMLKNALIVPQGAKGGFIVKDKKPQPSQIKTAYVNFMRALLEVTDNLKEGQLVRPPHVVSYDGDDPYLVVAADRGTARFSDIANRISVEYEYWLKDAFASGGSRGYDHKKLGITAKGAWECARRHFYELGRNLEEETITVIGIGSMDGDVFGNGMLLSKQIKLLAAFSGRAIFIDPNPDPKIAYQERLRLFQSGASWDQYNPELISEGGGVYPRQAKSIPLSTQVRRWLGVRHKVLDSETLIRHILMAEADLMWLGGIGTYVKASWEKHHEVGDPANDAVRVDANQLQVKVVAEGANLGFTQYGRVEYASLGGKINMDAIDNSAGVDLSDHEVNLKILLYSLQEKQELGDKTPYYWLSRVCGDVVNKVLGHNASQSLCISIDLLRCRRDSAPFLDLADRLENAGLLKRALESFPGSEQVIARSDQSLTRPELAVLLSLTKLQLKQALLVRPTFLRQNFLQGYLRDYFPAELSKQFGSSITQHPLAAEITATALSNHILDRAGATFLGRIEEVSSPLIEHAVALYLTFDGVLGTALLRQNLLDRAGVFPCDRLYSLLLRIEDALALCLSWFLNRGRSLMPKPEIIQRCQNFLQAYSHRFVTEDTLEIDQLQSEGLEDEDARRLVLLKQLYDFPVLVDLAINNPMDFTEIAQTYFTVAEFLGLSSILESLALIPVRSDWESRLKQALFLRFKGANASLTRHLISGAGDVGMVCTSPVCLQKFSRFQRLRRELESHPPTDLLPFATLGAEMEGMVEALA